ncbi:Glycine betaine transport system permease protein OpuAB [Streptomyces sp. YIM 130001]|uniref:ABC transporter permease n=1 Tax=Streptomyces sp. YIM 130001 TaxID=2259644 RepID=UPI000E653305|nr:ABC transporter permease subunit [Streptomyces sp. YIM 130001]RII21083.1 Glycine betaine transport system permease protein OpuAB [Streptomyces sp. YIM 130001]
MSAAPSPVLDKPNRSPDRGPGPANDDATPSLPARLLASPRALAVVVALLVAVVSAAVTGTGVWPHDLTFDAQSPLDDLNAWLVDNRTTHPLFLYFLLHISNTAQSSVDAVLSGLEALGFIGVTVLAVALAWYAGGAGLRRRALRTAGTALATFVAIGLLGMWEPAMETLALMVICVLVAALLGMLLGLAAGLSDRAERLLRPVFDTMQVLPAFAYLLPFVLIFEVGTPAALVTTVIYASPPMARLTSLGLRGADAAALEASASLGASPWQRLWTARLPLARKQMMLGLNQTIMMCLSMVVLASMIGAGGLGDAIYTALSTIDVGLALVPGIAIVLMAIWLDRTTSAAGERLDDPASAGGDRKPWLLWVIVLGSTAVATVIGAALGRKEWPEGWVVPISDPINAVVDWVEENLRSGVPVLGGTKTWGEGFATYVINPIRDGLQATPWWSLLLVVAVVAYLVGRWRAALAAVLALGVIGAMGLWTRSLDTLSQVIAGLVVTLILGFAIGLLAGRVDSVQRAIRPVLDTMQTIPPFIYLIPMIAFLDGGRPAGVAAAVLYALPAVVRITAQGIRTTDPAALEASRSLGASTGQQLRQVQVPLARPALQLAVNQGLVLVLAMVVIGGMVGGGALGYDVVKGLAKGDLGLGMTAGIAIVCLGIVLDRISQPGKDVKERNL